MGGDGGSVAQECSSREVEEEEEEKRGHQAGVTNDTFF
jgi:hypothetical protein